MLSKAVHCFLNQCILAACGAALYSVVYQQCIIAGLCVALARKSPQGAGPSVCRHSEQCA